MLGLVCVVWFFVNILLFTTVLGGLNPVTDAGYTITGNYSSINSSIDTGFSIVTVIGSLTSYAGFLFLGIGIPDIPGYAQIFISMIYLFFDVLGILFVLSFTE